MVISLKKIIAQLVFNCPLLPTTQNILAGKRPMTQKFLATPLALNQTIIRVREYFIEITTISD
jgi:hypothetical protein